MMGSIDELKNEMKKSALNIVLKTFPQKIVELDSLLQNDHKFGSGFDVTDGMEIIANESKPIIDQLNGECSSQSNTGLSDLDKYDKDKVCLTEAYSNKHLVEMAALLKRELVAFTDCTLAISAGINLMIPQMEDGNNFGVDIQQEVINNTINAENDIYQRIHEIHKYFIARSELVIKLIKHPNCQDFKFAVIERDRQFHRFIRISLATLRNHYMALEDMVTKNLNKIKKPKSGVTNDFLY